MIQTGFQPNAAPVDSSSVAWSVEGGSVLSRLTDHSNDYNWNGCGAEKDHDNDGVRHNIGAKLPGGSPVGLSQSQRSPDDPVGAGKGDMREEDDSISPPRSPKQPLYHAQSTMHDFVPLCSEERWDLVARQVRKTDVGDWCRRWAIWEIAV